MAASNFVLEAADSLSTQEAAFVKESRGLRLKDSYLVWEDRACELHVGLAYMGRPHL